MSVDTEVSTVRQCSSCTHARSAHDIMGCGVLDPPCSCNAPDGVPQYAPDTCTVAGCENLRAGHETARMCWSHEGNFIEQAAYAQGIADAAKIADGCAAEAAAILEQGQAPGYAPDWRAHWAGEIDASREIASDIRALIERKRTP